VKAHVPGSGGELGMHLDIARQPFGPIAVANRDAGADAYTHIAMDQAWQVVGELPA